MASDTYVYYEIHYKSKGTKDWSFYTHDSDKATAEKMYEKFKSMRKMRSKIVEVTVTKTRITE